MVGRNLPYECSTVEYGRMLPPCGSTTKARMVAAYMIDTVVPADTPPAPPCLRRGQTACVAAWAEVHEGDFDALTSTDTVAFTEASRIVGFSPRALRQAATIGLITMVKDDLGRERLCRSDVLAFAKEYCSSKQIRCANGMTPPQLYKEIQKAGIKMINLNGTIVMRRAASLKHGLMPVNER